MILVTDIGRNYQYYLPMPLSLLKFQPFSDLTPDEVRALAPMFIDWQCPAQEYIIAQGRPATSLFLLIEGEVSLVYKPYDGDLMILSKISAGNAFGWSAALGNANYSSYVLCDTECSGLFIRKKELYRLISQHPALGQKVLDRLSKTVSSRWEDAEAQVKLILNEAAKEKR